MNSKTRSISRPSPALVISLIALFAALGGTSYAVATNSIDSREIKNGTIQGKDLKNRSIQGTKIQQDKIGGNAVKESTLGKVPSAGTADSAANAGRANTAGSADNATNAGNAGALGGVPAGGYPSNVEIVTADSATVAPDDAVYGFALVTATCPAGKKVIGGGGGNTFTGIVLAGTRLNVALQDSQPVADATGWRVTSIESGDMNEEGQPWKAQAFAVCATR